jgi:hypothetical protein
MSSGLAEFQRQNRRQRRAREAALREMRSTRLLVEVLSVPEAVRHPRYATAAIEAVSAAYGGDRDCFACSRTFGASTPLVQVVLIERLKGGTYVLAGGLCPACVGDKATFYAAVARDFDVDLKMLLTVHDAPVAAQ